MLFQCSNKLPMSARKLLYQNLQEPFVTGQLSAEEIFRSGSLKGVRKKGWLRWNQKFSIPVCHRDRFLIIKGEIGKTKPTWNDESLSINRISPFLVNQRSHFGDDILVASAVILTEDLERLLMIDGWLRLQR